MSNTTTRGLGRTVPDDQTLPQADLGVNYGTQGVGGTFLQRGTPGVLGSQVTTVIPGSVVDAFSTLFRNDFPRWTVQMNLSYPIGLSSQQARVLQQEMTRCRDFRPQQ